MTAVPSHYESADHAPLRPGTLPFHPIDLCQPDTCKSCAACCGLYNWHDHSRQALNHIVGIQTDLFLGRSAYRDLDAYRKQRAQLIDNSKLFETIYNCEFIGFVDPGRSRVGCLLHPSVTGDAGLRDNCFYGAKICHEHFCPGFGCLTAVEQQAVIAAVDDWYLYGLVITDIDLVKGFFHHVETRMGDNIKPARLSNTGLQAVLHDFFSLKEHWPFKADTNRLGKYYFSESEYAVARIDYRARWGAPKSTWDTILVSLESDLASLEQLRAAEALLQDTVDAFIHAYIQT